MSNKSPWSEYIDRLKAEPMSGPRVELNIEYGYRIRILNRGEDLFYQEGNRALICLIDPKLASIDASSIINWDDGSIILPNEKDIILSRIVSYFKKYQNASAEILYRNYFSLLLTRAGKAKSQLARC